MQEWSEEQLQKAAELYGQAIGEGGSPKEALAKVMRFAVSEPSSGACDHRDARFGCPACVAGVRSRHPEFPLQTTRGSHGPASVPWPVAERAWAAYSAKYGRQQSVERLAQRGGFGWGDMDELFPGWRDATDEWKKLASSLKDVQGEAEALRARVAELATEVSREQEMRRMEHEALSSAVATARAEAERLKAERTREMKSRGALIARMNAAEARLASIRDMTAAQLDATRRAIVTEKAKPRPSHARIAEFQMAEVALEPLAKVLDGGAPQEDSDQCPRGDHHISEHAQGGKHPLCGTERHPSSDAATPGRPERVKERSEATIAAAAFLGDTAQTLAESHDDAMEQTVSEHNRHVDSMGGPHNEGVDEDDPERTLRAFLAEGEAPCTCADTMDGDPACRHCNAKDEARAALDELSEREYAKGHAAGVEAMRAAEGRSRRPRGQRHGGHPAAGGDGATTERGLPTMRTCRCCGSPAHLRASARGLCLGHALIFLFGPWATVEEFILTRRTS